MAEEVARSAGATGSTPAPSPSEDDTGHAAASQPQLGLVAGHERSGGRAGACPGHERQAAGQQRSSAGALPPGLVVVGGSAHPLNRAA